MSEEVKKTEMVVPRYVEFETTGEELWAVDRFDRLVADFGLDYADLPEWHKVMSGQGRAWEIAFRYYQAGSLTDPHEDVLREWSLVDLGKSLGLPKAQIESEIAHAVKQWKLQHARAEVAREAGAEAGESEIDQLTAFSDASGIEAATVEKLLKAFNFHEVKDELLRAQVAKRILSLKEYLSSPHTRTSAREIIRMEITMHALEKTLTGISNKIDRLNDEDPERKVSGSEIDGLSKKVQEMNAEIRRISLAHAKTQKLLGADDIDMTTRKRIFVETVAFIMEKCREYESDPENVLVDGVFRAKEIDWLLDPLGQRGPQYRPDISVRLAEALTPENLWDPDYIPKPLTKRVCQELRMIVERLRGVDEDTPALPEGMGDEDEGGAGAASVLDVAVHDGPVAGAVALPPGFGQRREDAPAAGFFSEE